MSEKIYYGKPTSASVNGERMPAKFAIVDIANTYAPDVDIDYDPESIIQIESDLTDFLESGNYSIAPIVDENLNAVSAGNNQLIALKFLKAKKPELYDIYIEKLASDIEQFGFKWTTGTALRMKDDIILPGSSFNDPKRIKFENPILVRVVKNEAKTTDDEPVYDQFSPAIKTMTMNEETTDLVQAVEAAPVETFVNLWVNDNWYKQHPEKLLGEAYQTSGRFGEVTKYRGGLNDLTKIDVPLNFIGANKQSQDPLASVIPEVNLSAEANKPEVDAFLQQVVQQSFEDVTSVKVQRKKKKDSMQVEDSIAFSTDQTEIQSFQEIYAKYNPEISRDELRAFIWYKTNTGKPLSRQWVNLLGETIYTDNLLAPAYYQLDEAELSELVQKGILYYYSGKLIPAFLYLSGDVYAKKAAIANDRDEIITKYGQSVYDNQIAAMDAVFKVKYDSRLTLQGNSESGLKLLPIAKFSMNFFIERLDDMAEDSKFKIKRVEATSNKWFGLPDWEKDADASEWGRNKRHEFESLNLNEAFGYWLMTTSPELKEPVSYWDIIKIYLRQSPPRVSETDGSEEAAKMRAQIEKQKSSCQKEGERLFQVFLESALTTSDKVRLETEWNSQYNNYVPVDLNKVPVAFRMVRNIKGKEETLLPEKREAVAFMLIEGVGAISYDVGVGKTPSAIFTMSAFIDAGYAKRPFVVVPNQVYKQFMTEIKTFCPHLPINEAYNLSEEYLENFRNNKGEVTEVPAGSVTIMTYEGFERIGFNDETSGQLLSELYTILNQGDEDAGSGSKRSEKKRASLFERLETMIGKGLKGTMIEIESLGFDFGIYDESHKMKKVFTRVQGEMKDAKKGDGQVREKSGYEITSGTPSSIGLKGFMINQYLLRKSKGQNVMLLTATPFTNSPLEIFSMLTMLGYDQLRKTDLNNIKNFFDTYIATSVELVIGSNLRPAFKQVVTGFNNLISLQLLIRRFILYKTGEEIESVRKARPKKWVLPLTRKIDGETVAEMDATERIDTFVPMTGSQAMMMQDIIEYTEGKSEMGQMSLLDMDDEDDESDDDTDILSELENMEDENRVASVLRMVFKTSYLDKVLKAHKVSKINPKDDHYAEYAREAAVEMIADDGAKLDAETKTKFNNWLTAAVKKINKAKTQAVQVDESDLDDRQKRAVRILKGLNFARNLALSPYLFVYSGLRNPNYKEYVESSPKLKYVMECIRSVKMYHEAKGTPVSGQVIYMDRGIQYFPLLRRYLIEELGYKAHEIGIIKSGLPATGTRSKEYIKNLFNGEIYNEDTKQFDLVSDDQRIKVVIGSSTIKEGINLQRYGTVLYNCFLDWNPTDIQQLEGRIFRQGNLYWNVRIVNPLVIDSADIFIFQKLQEKTSRLNSIWSMDGKKNVLDTNDFNPEELKYALIRDPNVIAELKQIEEKNQFEGDKISNNRLLERLQQVKKNVAEINSNFSSLLESISEYRDFSFSNNKFEDAAKLADMINKLEKSQTDKEGKKMVDSYVKSYERNPEVLASYSNLSKYYKPWRFSDYALAVRDTKRALKDFIVPYNIRFDLSDTTGLDEFALSVEQRLKEIEEKTKLIDSDQYRAQLVEQIKQERADKKIEPKNLGQVVIEFAKLNYLLDDRKIITQPQKLYTSCPPMDGDRYSIEPEALAVLDACINSLPQTKAATFNAETGTYHANREELHNEIIDELFEDVRCVTKTKPLAVFTGGSPASGKSRFLKVQAPYLLSSDVFHLDADEIRSKLPEYKGWNANISHEETGDIVNSILQRLGEQSCRYDFVYDGTMNKAKKYFSLINKVKKLGYDTFIIFMEVPYNVAKKRALERYQKSGRYVPQFVIDEFFEEMPSGLSRGQDSLNQLKDLVDGYIVVNGETGEIIERKGMELPREREYGQRLLDADGKEMPKIEIKKLKRDQTGTNKPASSKEKTEALIKGLNLAKKFTDKEGQQKIEKQIKSLTISLKFL